MVQCAPPPNASIDNRRSANSVAAVVCASRLGLYGGGFLMRQLDRPTTGGSRRALAGMGLLVVLLIGTTILPWHRATATNSAPLPVKVARVTTGDVLGTVSLNGDIRPVNQLDVTSRVGARVVAVPVTVGQAVRAGDVLAQLDRTQQEVALVQAQAAIVKEQSALEKARVALDQPIDIASLEANIRAAEAELAEVLAGPRAEDVDIAVQKLSQANDTRARTASSLSNAKEQARIAMEQATFALQATQALYGAAKLIYDEAVRTGKDPNIPGPCPDSNRNCRDLTDARLRSYKATYEAAEINLRSAEALVEARRLSYQDARNQEVGGLRIASAQVQDAQAGLDKARSGPTADAVARAQADLVEARADLARALEPRSRADLRAAEASLRSAEASLRLAEVNLGETRVVAPFDGIVTQRFVSVGSSVSSGGSIVQLVSQQVEVRLSADDSQVAQLAVGQEATIRLSAFPGATFKARIGGISPSADVTSRTFTVTLATVEPDPRLKPGMLAQGEVAAIERRGVLTIPATAVISRGVESAVFVVADGKARRKAVTLGVAGGGVVEVLSGLANGESIVVDGQAALTDNVEVTVVS
jgi:HlyD family secretion protein